MKVKLFLEHLTQEQFATDLSSNWNGNVWSVSCCVVNFGGRPRKAEVKLPGPDRGFALRREGEGGIFWDPITNGVYTVDEEAYNAILELDRGLSESEVARRIGVKTKDVMKLVRKLNKIQGKS